MIICGIMEGNFRLSELKILVECRQNIIVSLSSHGWRWRGWWILKIKIVLLIFKILIIFSMRINVVHTSDPLLSEPPNGNCFLVFSCERAGLGRIKYKAKAMTTQIPVKKMKLVSSLFDANGSSNLCTIKIIV